jgi:hypothetical protein
MLEQTLLDRVIPRISKYDKYDQKIRLSHLRYTDDGYIATQKLINDRKYFNLTDYAKDNLLSKLGIPKSYFTKISERNKKLSVEMINDGLLSDKDYYTVKFMDDHIRGVLSSDVKTLDDMTMITAIQQGLGDTEYELRSLHVDHNGLFLKLLFKDTFDDTSVYARTTSLRGGITITNSDNLYSETSVKPFLFRQVCTNDATMTSEKSFILKNNVGFSKEDLSYRISSLVSYSVLNGGEYARTALSLNTMSIQKDKIKGIIERLCNENNLSVNEIKQVIVSFNKEPLFTPFGICNAFTDCAKNFETTDLFKKQKLEDIGGQYFNLPKDNWKELLKIA